MYTGEILASMKKVEAARDANLALEPRRMTAEEKDALLSAYHPDYKESEFETLKTGVSRGDKVPHELAALLQGKPRIAAGDVDLSKVDYDTDVLIIGGGGAGSRCQYSWRSTTRGACVMITWSWLTTPSMRKTRRCSGQVRWV